MGVTLFGVNSVKSKINSIWELELLTLDYASNEDENDLQKRLFEPKS